MRALTPGKRVLSDSTGLIRQDRDRRSAGSSTPASRANGSSLAEVCNVAWKRLRAGEITEEHATRAMAHISRLVDVLSPMAELAPRALEIARALDHPAYDCFYLTLAEREHTYLVTADEVRVRRVARTPWARHVRPLLSRGRRK